MSILKRIDDGNWQEAFYFADFGREDVGVILAVDDGQNDYDNWVGVFQLRDGSFGYLSAGCDYTGWDCQAWGDAFRGHTLEETLAHMTESDWDRLGDQLAPFMS